MNFVPITEKDIEREPYSFRVQYIPLPEIFKKVEDFPSIRYRVNNKPHSCRINRISTDEMRNGEFRTYADFRVLRGDLNNDIRICWDSDGQLRCYYSNDIELLNYALREIYYHFINPHKKKLLLLST